MITKKRNKAKGATALFLWFVALLTVFVWIALSPSLDYEPWWDWRAKTVVILILALIVDRATALAFWGVPFHYVNGTIAVTVAVAMWRTARKVYRWADSMSEEENGDSLPVPVRMAKRSLDAIAAHPNLLHKATSVLVGYDASKKPIIADLGNDRHTMVGASTGGGKTTVLRSFIVQLIAKPKPPQIWLIDLKSNPEDMLSLFAPVVDRYIKDSNAAMAALMELLELVEHRNKAGRTTPRIIVIVDEVATLTKHYDRDFATASKRIVAHLGMRARSAGINLVIATQDPVYTTVPKEITVNLLRKLMLVVSSPDQARVIMDFRPGVPLPQTPGEFLLKDGVGLKRGHTLLVERPEIQELLAAKLADLKDPRLILWREVSLGRKVGSSMPGINRIAPQLREKHDWATQTFVTYAYRNYANAGIFDPPSAGGVYRLAVEFVEGVEKLRPFIEEGKWKEAPEPVI